jgi:hypothetical protein
MQIDESDEHSQNAPASTQQSSEPDSEIIVDKDPHS